MKGFILLLFILIAGLTKAQDVFQKKLFSIDLILKYGDAINLSDRQEATVKKTYNDHITEFNSLKWELDAQMVKMGRLISSDQVDNENALKRMDDLLNLENKLKKMRFAVMLELKSQLTEAQQQQLRELKSEYEEEGLNMITPINENPRVMVKVDGAESAGEPLYILKDKQGQRRVVSSISDINPKDIYSIQVFKGEQGVDKFGEEGKNGVIIITLKSKL